MLDISSSGMGAMKILDDGIRVTGRAEFDRPVHLRNLVTAEVLFFKLIFTIPSLIRAAH